MDSRPLTFNIVNLIILAFSLSGCATYTIQPESLFKQLRDNQKISNYFRVPKWQQNLPVPLLTDLSIERNGIKKITCLNSDGDPVYLSTDHTTQLEIYLKSTKETKKIYFDTALILDEQLIGYRTRFASRLIKATQVPLDDIEKIEIFTEFPMTEKVKGE
jgi:hypothetical protein